ncbi:MAG: radical SAM protein [Myxococcota bacterium]|nr:radical SAM protein [Myxococcota bacterium]
MQKLNFQDHRRTLHENRYVYAVISRRAKGLSIGINLNPDKSCNFACPYCQVDRTVAGGERRVDIDVLREELQRLLEWVENGVLWDIAPFNTAAPALRIVRDVSFAGDGEPTSCAQFAEAVSCTGELLRRFGLQDVKFQLLTNATLFHKKRVRDALSLFASFGGVIWAKLDAGTEPWFQRVDGTRFPFDKILQNIEWASQQQSLVIQAMFHRFGEEAPTAKEIHAWCHRILTILENKGRISLVQIYSVARQPADKSVQPLARAELVRIKEQLESVICQHPDVEVLVY